MIFIKEKLEVIPTQITPLSEKMVMKDRYGSGSKGLKIVSPEEIILKRIMITDFSTPY